MDAAIEILVWIREHPRTAIAVLAGLMALYGLAQRKQRVFREAERDFERLRDDRGPSYDKTRPLS